MDASKSKHGAQGTFAFAIEPAFWQEVSSLKLNLIRGSNLPCALRAHYEPGRPQSSPANALTSPQCMHLTQNSIQQSKDSKKEGGHGNDYEDSLPHAACVVPGTLRVFNSKHEVEDARVQRLAFTSTTRIIARKILGKNNESVASASALHEFVILAYADIKRYTFYHLAAWPVLARKQIESILEHATNFKHITEPTFNLSNLTKETIRNCAFLVSETASNSEKTFHNINELTKIENKRDLAQIGFIDPCALEFTPGWPIFNTLAYAVALGFRNIRVHCIRMTGHKAYKYGTSFSFDLENVPESMATSVTSELERLTTEESTDEPLYGWELSEDSVLCVQKTDLSGTLDPVRMATSALQLNLKLMRWHQAPDLDLERIAETKCLLVGAGTLGCGVARALLAWGVKTITFVDCAHVSYSNPARQSLYNFEDCIVNPQTNLSKPKSEAAVDRLRQVYPGEDVLFSGHNVVVPMPGHGIHGSLAEFSEKIRFLDSLIKEHDIVFLLTDSRESRWFPAISAAANNRLAITAAIGFDGYLVMRHSKKLGCYFCNDVVGPTDTVTLRPLDQQCTVSRPGLAHVAAGMAAELAVSLILHPNCDEYKTAVEKGEQSRLPPPPHQVRGSLASWDCLRITGTSAASHCPACSETVVQAYRNGMVELIADACSDSAALERLSGLSKLHDLADEINEKVHLLDDFDDTDNDSNSASKDETE